MPGYELEIGYTRKSEIRQRTKTNLLMSGIEPTEAIKLGLTLARLKWPQERGVFCWINKELP